MLCVTSSMDLRVNRGVRLGWRGEAAEAGAGHGAWLYRALASQQTEASHCDLRLVASGGEAVHCHKLVLAAHSRYLR